MAARMGMTPSAYVRQCSLSGLNGSLGQANIDFITQIMTEQIRAAMQPFEERMTKLQVKTCIQAGTALYTSAEAINRLVPADYQEDMVEIVNNARKKAVQYVKRTEE